MEKSHSKAPPIIFIHFGNAKYLQYTLKCAKSFNPDTRIILLGDYANKHFERIGIEHKYFSFYENSDEIVTFERVYKFIAGKDHGNRFWVYFVIKRWFYLYNFIKEQGIEHFWTFDSDNLIMCDLKTQVSKFDSFNCTDQCNGSCMNGFINGQQVVKGYLDVINQLFQDEEYLNIQRYDFEIRPDWAFTEMRAYAEYKKRSNIKTIRLNTIINDQTFDDCVCQEHDMQMTKNNRTKKLFFKNGMIYTFHKPSSKYVKVNTINMSWVKLHIIKEVYKYVINNHTDKFIRSIFVIKALNGFIRLDNFITQSIKFVLNKFRFK